nr:hypothetical protein [Tanacetum cinerariifolium]
MSSANTRDASRKTYFLSNRTGSMKFVVPPADTSAIFPISVRFSEQVLSATLRGDNYDQYQVLYSISHETGQLEGFQWFLALRLFSCRAHLKFIFRVELIWKELESRFKNLMGMESGGSLLLFLLHVRSSIAMNKSVVKLLMVLYLWKLSPRVAFVVNRYRDDGVKMVDRCRSMILYKEFATNTLNSTKSCTLQQDHERTSKLARAPQQECEGPFEQCGGDKYDYDDEMQFAL